MPVFDTKAEQHYLLVGQDVDLSGQFPLPEPELLLKQVKPRPVPEGVQDQPRPPRYDYRKRKVAISTTNRFKGAGPIASSVRPGVMTLDAVDRVELLEMLDTAVLNVEKAYASFTSEPPKFVTLLVVEPCSGRDGRQVGRYSVVASDKQIEGSKLLGDVDSII